MPFITVFASICVIIVVGLTIAAALSIIQSNALGGWQRVAWLIFALLIPIIGPALWFMQNAFGQKQRGGRVEVNSQRA